jgi:hypothetical protein
MSQYRIPNTVKIPTCIVVVLMTLAILLNPASAEDGEDLINLTANQSAEYLPSGQIAVTTTIEYTSYISALGIKVLLPEGCFFETIEGEYLPGIQPAQGSGGIIEFAWITPPPSPISITYTLSHASGGLGENKISAQVLYRRLAGQQTESIQPDPLILY